MKRILLPLIVFLFFAVSALAQTPTATPTAAFDFPNAPTLNQSVTGPSGQTLTWDSKKWVAVGAATGNFAPLLNPQNGQNNYAPINAPSFTGLTIVSQMQVANTFSAPTATLGNTTITTGSVLMMAGSAALYFNGIPPGGTCPAGQAVTAISNTIVPTCAAVAGAFLPLTGGTLSGPGNLTVAGTLSQQGSAVFTGGMTVSFGTTINNQFTANGPASFGNTVQLSGNATTALQAVPLQQLNAAIAASGPWLPVNNPTYTGTLSGPTQVNTGGIDSLTWDYGQGLQASLGLGYGNTTESSFLIGQGMSYNGNYPNSWTRGGNASYGPTAVGSIQMAGAATVITGDTGLTPAQQFTPTMLFSISPIAYPLIPAMGNQGIAAGATFWTPLILPVAVTGGPGNTSSVLFGPATTPNASLTTWSADNINLAAGAHVPSGSWVADATSATIYSGAAGSNNFYADTALTVGSNFSPTQVGSWSKSGINILTGSLFINGAQQFYNGTWTPMASCTGGKPAQDAWGYGDFSVSGNLVTVAGQMGWSTMTGGSGNAIMTNFPFAAVDTTGGGYRLNTVVSNAVPQYPGAGGEQYTKLLETIYNGNNYAAFNETNFGSLGYLVAMPCANVWTNQPSGAWFSGTYRFR